MAGYNIVHYIAEQLKSWGVQRIYGVIGNEVIPLVHALEETEGVEFIPVNHESAAAFMAATEAKLTGKLGVCLATVGPGMANLLNGLGDAFSDHVPVLVLTGQVKLGKIGTDFRQYINQQTFISPLAYYSELATQPDSLPDLLIKAMQVAVLQRGVTHLSLPLDLQEQPCFAEPKPYLDLLTGYVLLPDNSKINNAAHIIKKSKKPLLLFGGGARHAKEGILKLAERIGAGIIDTLRAKGTISGTHPLYLGSIGEGGTAEANALIREADLLIMIGANWYPELFISKSLPVIQIDLNPQNIGLTKALHETLIGKAEQVISLLLAALDEQMESTWRELVEEQHTKFMARREQETRIIPQRSPMHLAHVIGEVERLLPNDAIIVLDTGDHTYWFNRYFLGTAQQMLFSGKWLSIGYALPAANAAKLIHPEKVVFALIGDGSFLMNIGELSTAMRHGLPIHVLLVRNETYLIEDRHSKPKGYRPAANRLYNPDFTKLAESFGWKSFQIAKEAEIAPVLQEALAIKDQPVLIVAETIPEILKPNS